VLQRHLNAAHAVKVFNSIYRGTRRICVPGYAPVRSGNTGASNRKGRSALVLTILLIVLVLVLLFGGFGFSRRGRRGV
jgi:hypothetical protein